MSELKRIQMELRLTPHQMADRIGMDRRTVEKRLGDGQMTPLLSKKLLAIRDDHALQKTLVCEPANRILHAYREHKNEHLYPNHRHLYLFIGDMLVIVKDRLELMDRERNGNNDYEKAEFTFVLAHLSFSFAFHGPCWHELTKARPGYAKDTLQLYNTAIELVNKTDPSVLSDEQASHRSSFIELLELNAMETKWQMAKRRYLPRKECLKDLEERKILQRLHDASRSPYNVGVWQIPHNGLIYACQLHSLKDHDHYEDMKTFHEKLVEVQPGFHSWDFTPGEVKTLREDEDLKAFRQNFPHLDTSPSK